MWPLSQLKDSMWPLEAAMFITHLMSRLKKGHGVIENVRVHFIWSKFHAGQLSKLSVRHMKGSPSEGHECVKCVVMTGAKSESQDWQFRIRGFPVGLSRQAEQD